MFELDVQYVPIHSKAVRYVVGVSVVLSLCISSISTDAVDTEILDRCAIILSLLNANGPKAHLFDDGFGVLTAQIDGKIAEIGSERVIIVAVYGLPDSGKTFLINRLKSHYGNDALRGKEGAAIPATFEQLGKIDQIVRQEKRPFVFVLHEGEEFTPNRGANQQAKAILGRGFDVKVAVTKPQRQWLLPSEVSEYDIVLLNPEAQVKQ